MNNLIVCPNCHQQILDDGSLAGQLVACPFCNKQFNMPGVLVGSVAALPKAIAIATSRDNYEISCPHCSSRLHEDGRYSNQWVMCPFCNGQFRIPEMNSLVVFGSKRDVQSTHAVSVVFAPQGKFAGLAAVLSFFYLGLGQIYNGQIIKGVVLMIVPTCIWIVVLVGGLLASISLANIGPYLGALATVGVGVLGVWVWGMIDAYNTAETINRKHLRSLKRKTYL